jgi:hypothetical protein
VSDSPRHSSNDAPEWLQQFEELADARLGHGSSCEQIHPIMRRWFDQLLAGEPPEGRDSVLQATACLATEVLLSSPDFLTDALLEQVSEEELGIWVEQILMIGRAFEIALNRGELDDL